PRAMDVMRDDDDPTTFIFHLLGQTSVDGPVPLQELLMQICEKWDLITQKRGVKDVCPINYAQEEISRHREIGDSWGKAFTEFNDLLLQMGGKDGWVSHDEFEE